MHSASSLCYLLYILQSWTSSLEKNSHLFLHMTSLLLYPSTIALLPPNERTSLSAELPLQGSFDNHNHSARFPPFSIHTMRLAFNLIIRFYVHHRTFQFHWLPHPRGQMQNKPDTSTLIGNDPSNEILTVQQFAVKLTPV